MKIGVTGSSGLIGSALAPVLAAAGHTVTRLVRRPPPPGADAVLWDPAAGQTELAALEGYDAVVHLAGESIAGRWTAARKTKIRSSRVDGTRALAEALAKLARPPRVFVTASAIGYYGDRGAESVDETSASGSDFLAGVCREWEAAAEPVAGRGVRVVKLRFGIVLSRRGGALKPMLIPFKLGLGGRIGDGQQVMSWVALDDVVGAIAHVLSHDGVRGPVNVVAPEAATNAEFTRALGRALHRPTLFPVPAFAARLAFGEMADALLLGGARVAPRRLVESGYRFLYPKLDQALAHVLGQ